MVAYAQSRSATAALVCAFCWLMMAVAEAEEPVERAVPHHVNQADLEARRWSTEQLAEAGRRLFEAKFTLADGVGRPAATGNPFPQRRRDVSEKIVFARGEGPDANSCASCHQEPFVGGAGDFAVNVFTGLGQRTLPEHSIELTLANERGTPALHGSGLLELLAREITADLHQIREQALNSAKQQDESVRVKLTSKGIDFGWLTADPSGETDTMQVEGIDRDLVVKPFGAKGVITSLREFTINAANLHHGMQATERFGETMTGTNDFDQDGIMDELSEGDITALTIFQATLSCPGRRLPTSEKLLKEIQRGEQLFVTIGCAVCHPPELKLNSPVFTEPNPYHFEGNLQREAGRAPVSVDLAKFGDGSRIEKRDDHYIVRAMTDFKRHDISDNLRPHLRNEIVFERFLPTELFITRPLWGCGDTAPYGHRGDLVTLSEIIEAHGGEAADSADRYGKLANHEKAAVRAFLKSLCISPAGAPAIIPTTTALPLPYE
jgi:cytochrome c peroxidase